MSDRQIDRLFRQAVQAIREGDHKLGRSLLEQVVHANEGHEQAWLWLSSIVTDPEERAICLENVLTLNPENERARKALSALKAGEEPDITPLNTEEEPEAAPEPPTYDPLPPLRMQHGGIRALEGGLYSPSPAERQRQEREREAEFRASLEGYRSDATLVREEEHIRTTLSDLASAWAIASILGTFGAYEQELEHGGFVHVMVNLAVASLTQAITSFLPLVIFVAAPVLLERYLLSTYSFFGFETSAEVEAAVGTSVAEMGGAWDNVMGVILPQLASDQTGLTAPGLLASLPLLIVGYLVFTIMFTMVGEMYRSWITDLVATWLGGRGDVIKTMQALTITLAASSLLQLPLAVLIPLLPFGFTFYLLLLFQLHRFIMTAQAVGKVHRMGPLAGAGVVIISSGAAGASGAFLFMALGVFIALSGVG